MESIYKEGVKFKSKHSGGFKVIASGQETVSYFEAVKISSDGSGKKEYRNYLKDAFEVFIEPNETQKEAKKALNNISKMILNISKDLEKMKPYDVICALGGCVTLLDDEIDKLDLIE